MVARFRSGERERYWRDVMAEQQASGLSVVAFCRENDVADSLFYRWRRRLAEPDQGEGFLPEEHANDRGNPTQAVARFVPIELPSPHPRAGFEIVRPDGCRVLIPSGFEAADLREILRTIEEVSSC